MSKEFSATVLGKYLVDYFYCVNCGLLKTEKPYWLESAYQDAIAVTDTGLVKRNISNCKRVLPLIYGLFGTKAKILDVSGGYGLLARLLRDNGMNCYTIDKYCENIFAKSFEPEADFVADVLLSFEVLEHIDNPIEFLSDNFKKFKSKTIILSTSVYGDVIPEKTWWYYSFETGQHISFYQKKTLDALAKKLECNCYSMSNDFHMITNTKLPKLTKLVLSNKYLQKIYAMYIYTKNKNNSYTFKDHLLLKSKINGQNINNC